MKRKIFLILFLLVLLLPFGQVDARQCRYDNGAIMLDSNRKTCGGIECDINWNQFADNCPIIYAVKSTYNGEYLLIYSDFQECNSLSSSGAGNCISLSKDNNVATFSCLSVSNIPLRLARISSTIVTILKILVPVFLIIFGMIDLGKAVASSKEDEIKKGQKTFFKRLITAALVFFVIILVQFVIGLVSSDGKGITDCMNCFLNYRC